MAKDKKRKKPKKGKALKSQDITNIFSPGQYNVLFSNVSTPGNLSFEEIAEDLRVDNGGWGWGATFLDADRDGRLDIGATNGWSTENYENDPSRFFWNVRPGFPFKDVSKAVSFNDPDWGSSLIAFDLERDGDLDMLQSCNPGPLRLVENQLNGSATSNRYLVIQPRMELPNRLAIGAMVRIEVAGQQQMRLITAGTSFLGQEPAEAFFGVGRASMVDLVEIEWPGGGITCVRGVQTNQVLEVAKDGGVSSTSVGGAAPRGGRK